MYAFISGVSGNSRSRSFPRMEASDSLSRTLGMDFFIPFPFPNFGNGFFSFPSRSRILGMDFFHSLPVPELWEWIFSIPFPFPNWPFQSRESKGKMGDFKRCLYSNIFSFLYISYKIKMGVLKSKLHMWRCPIKQHPKFLCEKIISQPWLVQKPFLFHPDIVQPKY